MLYSDDDGATWTEITGYSYPGDMAQLANGNIIKVSASGTDVVCQISQDDGLTWGDIIIITGATNTQKDPKVTTLQNGDVIVVYSSDEDTSSQYEIKARKSTDGGATWGSTITVMDYATADRVEPHICRDIDNSLYCVAEYNSGAKLIFNRSTDHGETWGSEADLFDQADLCRHPRINLINGHLLVCTYVNSTSSKVGFVRRGIWEAFSANACPCAPETLGQILICKAELKWYGGFGIAADSWSFEAEYDFAMSNIIEDSPALSWRSEQDDIDCNIVIDLGTNQRSLIDAVGLFGCNLRTLDIQMNSSDSWGSPPIDETISFDMQTGTIDAVSGNGVQDSSFLAGYKDHELKGYYFRATSGTDSGKTWKIKDNIGSWFFLEISAGTNLSASDTFVIYQPYIADSITNTTPYQFLRIAISAQETAEGYYQIGSIILGRELTLSLNYSIGYKRTHQYGTEYLRTPSGTLIPIKSYGKKRIFTLSWNMIADTQLELESLMDFVEGKNLVLRPDPTDTFSAYLVKRIETMEDTHRFALNYFDISLTFEEIL